MESPAYVYLSRGSVPSREYFPSSSKMDSSGPGLYKSDTDVDYRIIQSFMREREGERERERERERELCIEEKGSVKSATFTPPRWASFLRCLDEINSQLQLEKFAAGENVAYRCHYGGGWCVLVTSGFTCVDLRQFYQPFGKLEWKPTRYASCFTSYIDMMCFLLLVYVLFFML